MIKAGDKVFKSIWFGNFYRPAFDDENFAAGIWFSRFAAEKREEESK